MKNFTSVLRSHSGAVQARIPSLRSVTKQKSTPPFCKVCRWLMVLLALTISMPVLAEVTLTSNNCQYEIQGTEGSRYLKIVFIKANGEVRVPYNMTVPIGDKKVSLSVKEVVAKSTNYDAIDYKVTKYIFEPGIKKVEIDGYHNSSVKSVIFEGDNTQVDIYFNGNYPLEEVKLPANITQLEKYSSFANCKTLKSVILPEKLEEIPASLFEGCSALTTLVIPNTVTKIGKNAFKESGLTQITLPESLTTIEASAFYKTKLETITIPEKVTAIPSGCFSLCEHLREVILPNTLTTISQNAFEDCPILESINIPSSLENIEKRAFHLQKYKVGNRYACPQCGRKRCFARYINEQGHITFPDNVGRCDHEQCCGYHYSPSDYFKDNPDANCNDDWRYKTPIKECRKKKPLPTFIDSKLVEQTLHGYSVNPLYRYISTVFGKEETERLFALYKVGTSKKWGGSTIFWQIDVNGNVRTGKIMKYDDKTGHRIKNPHSLMTWVHPELKLPDFTLRQCFFGEHLLTDKTTTKTVAIVESEKTAIIATHFMSDFVWLATGGMNGCFNKDAVEVLSGREVVLVPDLGATDKWKSKLPFLQSICKQVLVSNILEDNATNEQKTNGLDIADFLLMTETPQMALQRLIKQHPPLQHLIDSLGLVLVEES